MIILSIIIPGKDCSATILRALNSISQKNKSKIEIIYVDDNSTDNSLLLVNNFFINSTFAYQIIKNLHSLGPGNARNLGIRKASGQYLMFLDSDDEIDKKSFDEFFNDFEKLEKDFKAVYFDFRRSEIPINNFKRKDHYFFGETSNLVKQYVNHRMDGASTTAIYDREYILDKNIFFENGIFEDLDFNLKIFLNTKSIQYLNKQLLIKHYTLNSITNTISTNSIDSFLSSWLRVVALAKKHAIKFDLNSNDLSNGISAAVGGRIKQVIYSSLTPSDKLELLVFIKNWCENKSIVNYLNFDGMLQVNKILKLLWSLDLDNLDESSTLIDTIDRESRKTWSCKDIHESLFLAPDEIRTCCKRFFVNDEIRGDVVLINIQNKNKIPINVNEIIQAKKDLWLKINRGESTPCDGCPFMEFKIWDDLTDFQVNYLSMEQHSVCNLKCSYCDEKYYGGKTPSYDVMGTLENLNANGNFKSLETVVWGGGEPLLDRNFYKMFSFFSKINSNINQRILSNSKIFSNDICDELKTGQTELVTSIDAGTEETYLKVRGRGSLERVLKNLQKYIHNGSSDSVTIKYIFTDNNSTLYEIKNFIEKYREYKLEKAIFQISFDFKKDKLNDEVFSLAIHLYVELLKSGAKFIFFDDLFYFRLNNLASLSMNVQSFLDEYKTDFTYIKNGEEIDPFYVWGIGNQTKLLDKSLKILERWPILGFIDGINFTKENKYLNYQVFTPEILLQSKHRIFISAVQSNIKILRQIQNLGIDQSRIITELIY